MKRSITKALKEYERITKCATTGGAFYYSDIEQVRDSAITPRGEVDIVLAIGNALEAGYAIGYRKAKREARK